MRMRKKKHGAERIEACSAFLIQDFPLTTENIQKAFLSDAKSVSEEAEISEPTVEEQVSDSAESDVTVREKKPVTFAADSPIWLEIGCGKGAFICELAKRFPENRLLAMERVPDVAMLAMEKCKQNEIENVRFLVGDVSKHWDMFADGTVDRIYLNFSDPWPKAGHAKRRLTHRGFLAEYRRILKPDGAIFFKTDNRGLFDFSLDEFRECGFRLENLTYDLHNSEWAADNIMTEYEKNFSEKGFSINRVEAWCR